MSVEPAPSAGVLRPHERASDSELVAMLRAGDARAFDALAQRHVPALARYAARILRSDAGLVDDVVQEALLRAHRALLRDDRHIQVRPYLFRLVRNCSLDELARARTDTVALDVLHVADEPRSPAASPHDQLVARDETRQTLDAIAGLPAAQRHALVRRELDGLTHEQVAGELGVSIAASKNLVHRARENLSAVAEARDTLCEDIRHDLLVAHDQRRRPAMRALRHVASCRDCRAFRTVLKERRQTLRILAPGPALLAGGLASGVLAKGVVVLTGASQPVATKAGVVLAAGALAAGGAYALDPHVFGPGTRTPVAVQGVAVPGGRLAAGATVPAHMAVVTREVVVHPTARPAQAALACPAPMRVAGLVPTPGNHLSHGLDPRTVVGTSTTARVLIDTTGLAVSSQTLTLAVLCRVPGPGGSVRAAPASAAGRPLVHGCRRRATLRSRPGGRAAGTVTSHEPLAVLAASARWLRVRTDGGATGWLPAGVAC